MFIILKIVLYVLFIIQYNFNTNVTKHVIHKIYDAKYPHLENQFNVYL